ncbi:MAG: ferritin family protein [Dehalococcoidales bacterium]|nr:ferritin family protein [Dehalococcoidales bacterium]
MDAEQEKTLSALKYAIQMEIDGKEFYLKAAHESTSELGKKLLEALAKAEDFHRIKFEQVYENISKKKGWIKADISGDGGKGLRTIFAREIAKKPSQVKPAQTELEAVTKAQQMEAKTYDYYHAHSEQAGSAVEKEFFATIAAEEQEHNLILNDYYEYLKNPQDWFTKTERHSLDAG